MKYGALFVLMLTAAAAPVLAEPFGSSGGLKNESDVPVKVTMTRASGDYESLVLAVGGLLDLPEDTASVKIGENILDPVNSRTRIRVSVTQPDGSRVTLDRLGAEIVIEHPRGMLKPALALEGFSGRGDGFSDADGR